MKKLALVALCLLYPLFAHADDNKQVFDAARKGDIAGLKQYLAQSGDVNAKGRDGVTLLMAAADYRQYAILELLKENHADINLVDRDGKGLLHHYIKGFGTQDSLPENGKVDITFFVREISQLPYIADRQGQTPLHMAVTKQFAPPSLIAQLLHMQKDVDAVMTWNKRSALHVSVAEHVPALISAGANKDLQAADGGTALLFAIAENDEEKMKYLVSKGANLEIADQTGSTPLLLAASQGKPSRVNYLLDQGANITAENRNRQNALQLFLGSYYASRSKNDEEERTLLHLMDRLIRANANVDYQYDHRQATALLEAAENGNMAAVRYLLKKGASAKVTSSRHTILTALVHSGRGYYTLDDLRFLVKAGASTDDADEAGNTPLMLAMQDGDAEIANDIVPWLIAQGANVNHQNNNGQAPLILAAQKNNLEDIKLLIEKGAAVNAKDNDGVTALTSSCCRDEGFARARYLLEHGADINSHSRRNRTLPLCEFNIEQVGYLLDHGINPNIREKGVMPAAALDRCRDNALKALLRSRGALTDIEIATLSEQAFKAVDRNDLAGLKNALQAGFYVNNQGDERFPSGALSRHANKSLLDAAVINGNAAIASFLLENGADPGPSMLHAVAAGNLALVKLLVEHGADIKEEFTFPNKSYESQPLAFAIETKKTELVHYLISKGARMDQPPSAAKIKRLKEQANRPDLVRVTSAAAHWGELPIEAAVLTGDKAMVEFLLSHGAALELRDGRDVYRYDYLLVMAYTRGAADVGELLRSKGLEIPDAVYEIDRNNSLDESVMKAIQFNDRQRLKRFFDEGYSFEFLGESKGPSFQGSGADFWNFRAALYSAVKGHFVETLRYVDKESSGLLGISDAMLAAAAADPAALKVKITDQNIEAGDMFGATAFYYAVLARCEECALYLLERGADPNVSLKSPTASSDYSRLPMVMASRWSLVVTQKIMQRELAAGSQHPEVYNYALMAAVEAGQITVAKYLKQAGAKYEERAGLKYASMLAEAVFTNDTQLVYDLLELGADLNKVTATAYGTYTPFALACLVSRPEIIDRLFQYYVDSGVKSKAYPLAVEAAMHAGNMSVLSKMLSLHDELDFNQLLAKAADERNVDSVKAILEAAEKYSIALNEREAIRLELQGRLRTITAKGQSDLESEQLKKMLQQLEPKKLLESE